MKVKVKYVENVLQGNRYAIVWDLAQLLEHSCEMLASQESNIVEEPFSCFVFPHSSQ